MNKIEFLIFYRVFCCTNWQESEIIKNSKWQQIFRQLSMGTGVRIFKRMEVFVRLKKSQSKAFFCFSEPLVSTDGAGFLAGTFLRLSFESVVRSRIDKIKLCVLISR
jgi:hypothetical protein